MNIRVDWEVLIVIALLCAAAAILGMGMEG